MSIIVRGMEMPKCCEECVAGAYEYNDNDERCFICGFIKSQHPWECEHVEIDGIDTTKARADFCPLSEVPTPHGRLGDLDKLEKELQIARKDPYLKWEEARIYGKAISDVRVARTIIKAEGET